MMRRRSPVERSRGNSVCSTARETPAGSTAHTATEDKPKTKPKVKTDGAMQPAATPTPEASLVTKGAASDPKWPRARGTQPTARDDHRQTAILPVVIWCIESGRLQEFSGLSPMHRNHNREYHTANQRGTASPKMITTTSGSLRAMDEPKPGLRSASRVSAGRN